MPNTRVSREIFGETAEGLAVERFTLRAADGGVAAKVLSLGGILQALEAPGKAGPPVDVVLGFPSIHGYLEKHPYFGAVVGRVANRIAGGRFAVDGKDYTLAINNGPNSLHGGIVGFDKAVWLAEQLEDGVRLTHTSPDGDEGYPGALSATVTYRLVDNKLSINYRATTTRTTPVNLTNHAYFNLAGQGSPDIYDHEVTIMAEEYLPVDDTVIPTGEVAAVKDTPFDLRSPVILRDRLPQLPGDGFDHNFCLSQSGERQTCARACHAGRGCVMTVETTQPGVQFYTANFLDGSLQGKDGCTYPRHSAFCLETQNWPDAVNKPNFPNALLRPGEEYNHTTWFTFTVSP
ncbi:galactose mutarotase [Petromyzon marinus]|uniref:Aldose 1-epimerase n=1 Tax=Petromyzon marinus TaxID=7757 RepID=A0AAJ7XD26_PETMA|nr:aldose 1-epimerase [Petromyzon marinus]